MYSLMKYNPIPRRIYIYIYDIDFFKKKFPIQTLAIQIRITFFFNKKNVAVRSNAVNEADLIDI